MPMIGRGDGDGVNIFVLKQLTNVDVGFWLWQSELLDIPAALVQHAFIHIAQSGNLCSWDTGKPVNVILAATSHSANCHPDTITRAHHPGVTRRGGVQCRASDASAGEFQKIPPSSFL